MTPLGWALTALAGLWVAFTTGWWLGDHVRGRRAAWDHARDIEDLAQLSGELADAERDIEEHLEAAPRLWERGFQAGLHLAEFQLARTKVERDERSRARWN
jgi:hypothetical protein